MKPCVASKVANHLHTIGKCCSSLVVVLHQNHDCKNLIAPFSAWSSEWLFFPLLFHGLQVVLCKSLSPRYFEWWAWYWHIYFPVCWWDSGLSIGLSVFHSSSTSPSAHILYISNAMIFAIAFVWFAGAYHHLHMIDHSFTRWLILSMIL